MNFFGIGAAEAGLVFVIALLVIGPQRFPEVMRSAGRWYKVARTYSNEVMKDVRAAVDEIEREVKSEVDGLNVVRELEDIKGGMDADLKDAKASADQIGKDTGLASPPATATTPRQPIRPSARAGEATTPPARQPDEPEHDNGVS